MKQVEQLPAQTISICFFMFKNWPITGRLVRDYQHRGIE